MLFLLRNLKGEKMKAKKDVNYALFETTRPPMYTAMKYWGKKPHNIWANYIETYTPENGIFLDPFSGSAMSAFEALIQKKKAVAFDINPLTSFIIEVFTSNFDSVKFNESVLNIVSKIKNNKNYKAMFNYRENCVVHNVKYKEDIAYEVALVTYEGTRETIKPEAIDLEVIKQSDKLELMKLYPNKDFHNSISFSESFLKNIGKSFDKLYTRRNLYVLSEIFNEILKEQDNDIKKQLLFTFIKIVHLSTKMAVPRSKKSNRDFSTSWGRAAYIYSKKQMEMNPLLLFESAAVGKQSTTNALMDFKKRLNRNIKTQRINDVSEYQIMGIAEDIDLVYGKVDIKKITKLLPEKSIDFIMTDPPYGGLVQYLDLSSIWLSWLELYDRFYIPDYSSEIIVNCVKNIDDFEEDMKVALKNLRYVLKDEGKMLLTFNNKDLQTWKAFLKAIELSGMKIEKVIHQQNKRTGESNVSDPFGSSASDFYIRCIKSDKPYLREVSKEELDKIMLEITQDIIISRYEPTPYQILFNGVLSNMSLYNIDYKDIDSDFNKFLEKYEDKVFITSENLDNSAGNYWWLKEIKFDVKNKRSLTNRVNSFVNTIFEKNNKIEEFKLFEKIYKEFPNGLTPDPVTLDKIINKFTEKKGNYRIRRD